MDFSYITTMNHLLFSSLLIIASNLVSAVCIYFFSSKEYRNIWLAFSAVVCGWAFCLTKLSVAEDYALALAWARYSKYFAIFVPILFAHFVTILTKTNNTYKLHLHCTYLLVSIYFLACVCTPDLFIPKVSKILHYNYYYVPGNLFHIYPIYYATTIGISLFLLISKIPRATPIISRQYRVVTLGFLIGTVGGSSTLLLAYGIKMDVYLNYFCPIYILFVAYGVMKYQLMNIDLVITKSLTYTITAITITLLYLLLVYTLEMLSKILFAYESHLISIFTAFILGIIIFPMKSKIQTYFEIKIFNKPVISMAEEHAALLREVTEKEKFKAMSTLASGMAHEIKNPLTAIKTFNDYLPAKHMDREFVLKFCHLTGKEIQRINELVNQLIEYGRPGPCNFQPASPITILDNCQSLLSNQCLAKNIVCIKSYDLPNEAIVQVDRQQIHQAAMNLILNAIDAMPNGGELTVGLCQPQHGIFRLIVKDSGLGIPKKELPRIFDPFFSGKDFGTGLGLAIVKSIVEAHNGKIYIRSEPHIGTEFILDIPESQPAP